MKEIVASQEELGIVVAYLNEILPKNAIILLRGDLAAGKTTLVQAIASNRGLTSNDLQSESFAGLTPVTNDLQSESFAGLTPVTSNDLQSESFAGLTPVTIVTSPTFSLQHCYGEGLYHYDLYRLEHEEFMQLGLFEEFEKEGWHLVEWGSEALRDFLEGVGYTVYILEITPHHAGRKYSIKASDA